MIFLILKAFFFFYLHKTCLVNKSLPFKELTRPKDIWIYMCSLHKFGKSSLQHVYSHFDHFALFLDMSAIWTLSNSINMLTWALREQDNILPDNCPPQIVFSFIFSFWLPLSDSMNSIALLYFHFKIHSYLSQF